MKLTETMKKEILERVKDGERYKDIAKDYDVQPSAISHLARKNGYRARGGEKTGKTCPKCHRGGLPTDYIFCPFCAADIRSEKEIVIGILERAIELQKPPFQETEAKINFALQKALDFVKKTGD
jgi:hypothetical protein